MIIEDITVSGIIVDPRKRSLDPAKVEELVSSIRKLGLRTPITVRIVHNRLGDDGVMCSEVPMLVTGRHRLEAARILEWKEIPAIVSDGTEIEAKMWEIAENLHRADLTVLERSEHTAEWIELSDLKAQLAPLDKPHDRGRPNKGINDAVRDLGIERTEAQRAVKINGLSDEVKQAAKEAGLDDNQSALLEVVAEVSAKAQLAAIKQKKDHDEAQKRNRESDRALALEHAEEFAEYLFHKLTDVDRPIVIAWLECCKPKQVVAALRRLAA